ncbi:MAG: metal-dependent transcriptional regulator [Planctomycetota bacterium]|jgi:DtxR family Mn-dependent transcriptional regulator
MARKTKLNASAEDYLEAIFQLVAESGSARTGEIARLLGVHKSTVTGALHSLADKDLVEYSPYAAAQLTARGRRVAGEIVRRHHVLHRFLREVLLLDEAVAEANACRIEHGLDREVVDRLVACIESGEDGQSRSEWVERFRRTAGGEDAG